MRTDIINSVQIYDVRGNYGTEILSITSGRLHT